MKTFKSVLASAAIAAGTLSLVMATMPARAGINWNGPILQGPVLQGPILQGLTLNGPVLNGPILQGMRLNGVAIGSASRPGQFMAITLPGGETFPLH